MSQAAAEGARLIGHVKWFDAQKGWGFIQPTDGSDDVFVHQQSILAEGFRSLDDGEEVEYEVETDGNRRKRAVNVTGPGGAPVKGSSRNQSYGGRGGRGGPFHQNGGGRSGYDGGSFRGNRRGGYNRYDDQGSRYEERYDNRFDRQQPAEDYDNNRHNDYRRGGVSEWDRKQPRQGQGEQPQMVNHTYGSSSLGRDRM